MVLERTLPTIFHQVSSKPKNISLINFMEVEDQIQFTNITKVSIQDLNEMMNYLQNLKFIILLIHNRNKV